MKIQSKHASLFSSLGQVKGRDPNSYSCCKDWLCRVCQIANEFNGSVIITLLLLCSHLLYHKTIKFFFPVKVEQLH